MKAPFFPSVGPMRDRSPNPRSRGSARSGRPWLRPFSLSLALVFHLSAGTAAQEGLRDGPGGEPPVEIPRLSGTVTLDGRPDEAVWNDAAVFTGVMHLPDFGAEPSQRSEFLLFHDGESIYFACRAFEEDPTQVRTTTLARDVSMYNTDGCTFATDSYNDEENTLFFGMTPASVRTDWTFANDATGPPNMDWNTFWDARGTPTEYGWSGEMRIPFSSIGFQVGEDGRVVMGFSVGRSIVRNAERTIHPAIPPNWGPSSMVKPSQMRKMILTGVRARRPLYVTPYGLTGGGHVHALDAPGTGYLRDDTRVLEIGGDLRYGLTRNLNLDLTANTDFAQVESDNLQVNLTRFSLFFPEKRRFFQERAAIFEFPLGNNERLFHSRRIGLDAAGEPVTIYGGARLVGRVGDWDLGFIDMQTGGADVAIPGRPDLPSENMGVLRLRRRAFNPFSYVGGIVTSRLGTDGSYNVLYGSDAVVRLFGQDYLTVNWAQSFDGAGDGIAPTPVAADEVFIDRSLARVNVQRRGLDGVVYNVDLTRAGSEFEPGLGFLRRRDYTAGSASIGYGWRPAAGSALNRYSLTFSGNGYRRNRLESVESAALEIQAQIETRGSHQVSFNLGHAYEDLLRPFVLGDAVVPVGSYWFTEAALNYNPPGGALFRPGFNLAAGEFYDGSRISGSFSPTWSVSRHLSLGGAYQLDHIDFRSRDQDFTSHLARLRSDFTFTTRTSASAFVQYVSSGDLVIANLRFRYNPAEGRDLYLVWNEVMNADRYALEPIAPLSQQRSILLKYVHTFTLGL